MTSRTGVSPAWILTLSVLPLVALAQGTATILEPVSPPDSRPLSSAPMVAVNDAGHVMIVWRASRGNERPLLTACHAGGGWQVSEIPLPPGLTTWSGVDLSGLAWHGGRFSLLVHRAGHRYVYEWSGASWGAPLTLPDDVAGNRINYDADGNLVTLGFSTRHGTRFARRVAGQWQTVLFPEALRPAGHTEDELLRGRNGALHALGQGRANVPTVVSLPAGADPLQPASWVWRPPGSDQNSWLPTHLRQVTRIALDWPRQTVWAGRMYGNRLYVSAGPLGSTEQAAWTTWEVGLEEGERATSFALAAGSGGAVGLCYLSRERTGAQRLRFQWLLPGGPGERHDLIRPGTQTEAADFSNISSNAMSLRVGADGTAHLAVVGTKRGEHPGGLPRVYYSRISGGAVLATEPDVVGDGQQIVDTGDVPQTDDPPGDWTEAGGKPDLTATLELNRTPILRDGVEVYRYSRGSNTVRPTLRIHNHGSQYFGDVEVRIVIDGITINYRRLDDSNHMRPLIPRDGTIIEYRLPTLRYEFRPQPWEPPVLDFTHGDRGRTIPVYTGLGRKRITVVVDPHGRIDEHDKDNNTLEMEYEVSCGRDRPDRVEESDTRGRRQFVGLNDLAILGAPKLFANTQVAGPGLVQRPTLARMIVGNPRGATFFRDVPVVALLNGEEFWRQNLDLVDDERHLYNRDTQWYGFTGPPRRTGPEVMGGFVDVPVDLTDVPAGDHTLTLVVDPEDTFADLDRDNNSATIHFRVREPGGSLRVRVRDRVTGQPIGQAHLYLPDLYGARCDAHGEHVVHDLPAGAYQASQLLAGRPFPQPAYGRHPAARDFTIRRGQETAAEVLLEPPVDVVVTLVDARTGEPVQERAEASVQYTGPSQHLRSAAEPYMTRRQGIHTIRFMQVPPGTCEVSAVAYAYEPATRTVEIRRDANGECRVEMALQQAPVGQVMGLVVDGDNRPVPDASVWLSGTARATATDNAGNFTLTRVQAGRDYQVIAMKRSYLPDRVMTGPVRADETRSVLLRCQRLTHRVETLSVDCTAWARVESWPGFTFGKVQAGDYKVSAEHGKFTATMGMLYRDVQGQRRIILDAIVLGTSGKEFWNSNVSTSYSLSEIIGSAVEFAAGADIARLVALAKPLNETRAHLSGDVDPAQMRDGQVVGGYASQTGADYHSVTLIPMPKIPLAMGFQGGQTVVRTDILEVRDAYKTRTYRRQWYSPQTATYAIGDEFDPDSLEVRFYMAVLNERLSPGPLHTASRNVLRWKPLETNWLRMEPAVYDAIGLQ